jgi:hypothetical protein
MGLSRLPVGLTRGGMLQIGKPRADADVLAAAQSLEQSGQFAAMIPRLIETYRLNDQARNRSVRESIGRKHLRLGAARIGTRFHHTGP